MVELVLTDLADEGRACADNSVARASWTDVFLLTLIEMGLFAAAVGAGGIMELMERLCERVEDVLTI